MNEIITYFPITECKKSTQLFDSVRNDNNHYINPSAYHFSPLVKQI